MKRAFSFDAYRLILSLFVCIISFGLPSNAGLYVQFISGFATISFFIISGYLVLGEQEFFEERLTRAIKRTAITFGIMLVAFFVLSVVYLTLVNGSVMHYLRSKRNWLEFVVFNYWHLPIGSPIWFIQCLLYGYIAVLILHKLKLLKYDWIIACICLVITVLTGELAKVINFSFFGYHSIPMTVVTGSLPYLLLGRFFCRSMEKLQKLPSLALSGLAIFGVLASIYELSVLAESEKLIYIGHLIGNGITASAICIAMARVPMWGVTTAMQFVRRTPKVVYIVHQPIGMFLALLLMWIAPQYQKTFEGCLMIMVFGLSLLVSWLVYLILPGRKVILREKGHNGHGIFRAMRYRYRHRSHYHFELHPIKRFRYYRRTRSGYHIEFHPIREFRLFRYRLRHRHHKRYD